MKHNTDSTVYINPSHKEATSPAKINLCKHPGREKANQRKAKSKGGKEVKEKVMRM